MSDSSPPADSLPELQAKIDLAVRNMTLLERRIASWENELTELRAELRAQTNSEPDEDTLRFTDLESRVARLERRSMRDRAQAVLAAPSVGIIEASTVSSAPDTRVLVYARWSEDEGKPRSTVELTVRADGIEDGEEITFQIVGLDGTIPCDPIKGKVKDDIATVKWKIPALSKGNSREYYFDAICEDQSARSPVLLVRS